MKYLPETDIEYLTHHWPVVTGCSFGCPWCWARAAASRFPSINRDAKGGAHPFVCPQLHLDRLDLPLRRRKPARIGVCFTGDLFGPEIHDEFIMYVFDRMTTDILRPCLHTYLVLTKRARRMKQFLDQHTALGTKPRPNVWLGVSVTTQAEADERIPLLLQTPAAHRWVSMEPMLGSIVLDIEPGKYLRCGSCGYTARDKQEQGDHYLCKGSTPSLDWVVIGSIDRPSAQYPAPRREWIENIVEQCRAAGVPVWVKNNVRDKGPWPQQLPEGMV